MIGHYRVVFAGVESIRLYDAISYASNTASPWQLPAAPTGDYNDVVYGGNMVVAVGNGDIIIYSDDRGANWAVAHDGSFTTNDFHGVAHGDGLFIAVGGNIMYSTDGINWTESAYVPAATMRGIGFGGVSFVLVGPSSGRTGNPIILVTTDGESFNTGTSAVTESLNDVVYDPGDPFGRFIAVGNNGTIIYSDDVGASWVTVTSGTSSHLKGIAYGDGTLVAVGISSVAGGNSDSVYSTDHGATWSLLPSGYPMNDVTYTP
jgi:photosystem II stability/assembly factor-like uncharacterized protein